MRGYKPLFLTLILLATLLLPVLAMGAPSYGEDEPYLGQVVDSYVNNDSVASTYQVVHNQTLGCMELNYSDGVEYLQDFNSYTEVEEGTEINIVNGTYVDMVLSRDWTSYAYYDFGVSGLNDYKMYGLFRQDYHNSDGWGAFCMMSNYLGGEKNHRDNTEDHTFLGVSGSTGAFRLWEYDSGSWYSTASKVLPDDIFYWFKLEKVDNLLEIDVYTSQALRDAEGNGDWYDSQLTLQNDYSFRYLYLGNSYDDVRSETLNMELYNLAFFGPGYEGGGHYYTEELISGDQALVLMYNATLPVNTVMTLELSSDNSTWVNHNNLTGYEGLVDGLESVDLRDLNTTSLHVRVNMTTTDPQATPRMYQLRLVTVTTISVATVPVGRYQALAIILLMLGLVLGMGIKR